VSDQIWRSVLTHGDKVETTRLVYAVGLGDDVVDAVGASVEAGSASAHVTGVGWEIESAAGSAQIFVAPGSVHRQPRLPHTVEAGETGQWMITPTEVSTAIVENLFGIEIDVRSATLRAFATVNGKRLVAHHRIALTVFDS
jgi:hypothetical protein